MAKDKYRQPKLEQKKHDPYVKTNYKETLYKRPAPKPIVETVPILTPGSWSKMMIVFMIPIVNLIAAIAWSKKKNPRLEANQKNLAKGAIAPVIFMNLLVAAIIALCLLIPR